MKKRIMAMFAVLLLLAGMMPVSVFAAAEKEGKEIIVQEVTEGETETPSEEPQEKLMQVVYGDTPLAGTDFVLVYAHGLSSSYKNTNGTVMVYNPGTEAFPMKIRITLPEGYCFGPSWMNTWIENGRFMAELSYSDWSDILRADILAVEKPAVLPQPKEISVLCNDEPLTDSIIAVSFENGERIPISYDGGKVSVAEPNDKETGVNVTITLPENYIFTDPNVQALTAKDQFGRYYIDNHFDNWQALLSGSGVWYAEKQVTPEIKEVEVFFDLYGGKFTFSTPDFGEQTGDNLGVIGVVGKSMTDVGVKVSDPIYPDGSKTFLGWMPSKLLDGGASSPLEDKVITTDEALKYIVQDFKMVFVAVWQDVKVEEEYQVSVNTGLKEVPQAIVNKYPTVQAVEDKMIETALASNKDFTAAAAKSVVLDVKLQVKTADGKWETVTYENFPKEGVEALLPYPEGTDKDNFDFIVAHMISEGSRAGEVEILKYTLEEKGIRVKFTSMSPVTIMYQLKATKITPEETPEVTPTPEVKPTVTPEAPKKDVPLTGDSNSVLFFALLMAAGMVVLAGSSRKIKA